MLKGIRAAAWVALVALAACAAPVDDTPRAEITLLGTLTGRSVDAELPAGVVVDVDGRAYAVETREGDTLSSLAARLAERMSEAGIDARADGPTVALDADADDASIASVGCYEVDEGLASTVSLGRR